MSFSYLIAGSAARLAKSIIDYNACHEGVNRQRTERRAEIIRFQSCLAGLCTSWRQPEPGLLEPYWFAVREICFDSTCEDNLQLLITCKRLHLRSAVDNLREAERGVVVDIYGRPLPEPLSVPLGDESEIVSDECPRCHAQAPLVGCVDFGADCDEGRLVTMVYTLCTDCVLLSPVAKLMPANDLAP